MQGLLGAVRWRDTLNNGSQNAGTSRHTWNGEVDFSAVAEHAAVQSHEIDRATAKLIDSVASTHTQKVKEALHIAQKAPSMNKDSGMSLKR